MNLAFFFFDGLLAERFVTFAFAEALVLGFFAAEGLGLSEGI